VSALNIDFFATGRHSMDGDDDQRARAAVVDFLSGECPDDILADIQRYEDLVELDAAGGYFIDDQAEDFRLLTLWFEGIEAAAHAAATQGWLDPNGLSLVVEITEACQ